MKFVPTQNSQQVPQQQQQQQQQQIQRHHPPFQPRHQTTSPVMNSSNAINGPSNIMNNANHTPQGMSYSSGPSASPLLSSTADAGTSDVGASSMSASDASNDAVNAHAASSSSGMMGGGGVMGAASSSSTGVASGSHLDSSSLVLSKKRLQDLVKEIDPMEVLDEDVEDVLLQIADDFIENVVTSGCMMAKHRKSSTLEVKDVQLHLQRNWNMWIPGFGGEELRPYKKAAVTDAHKQRLALIKKTLKKF